MHITDFAALGPAEMMCDNVPSDEVSRVLNWLGRTDFTRQLGVVGTESNARALGVLASRTGEFSFVLNPYAMQWAITTPRNNLVRRVSMLPPPFCTH